MIVLHHQRPPAIREIKDACIAPDGTRTKRLRMVAQALVNKAIGGDINAIREIADRISSSR